MSSDRWQRVQQIFTAAVESSAADRSAVLERACDGDVDLRREVESLLDAHERSGPLDRLASEVLAPALSRVHAQGPAWEGRTIGQYLVLEPLGAGGMGLLYKARDERLGRLVALKCLPPHLGADPAAKRRFLMEARAAAALDHPNVCTIHEIGETPEDQLFIAMPFYEGETLRTRLERGVLPVDEALAIALQVARGLAAAHEQGVVHRDVKPANVMLLADGTVKILDFGIAKVGTVTLTASGTRLGTVAYMSPEQARGELVDHRTDIWSLGIVLYEMLAGTRPFEAGEAEALIYAILTRPPDPLTALRSDLPPDVDDVVRAALAKAPERRYATMRAMAADLAALSMSAGTPDGSAPAGIRTARTSADGDTCLAATGERRRATVVVSVVGDYAALVERLTAGEVEHLVGRVRAAAVEVVRRHGGIVNQCLGEEIVSLFGVPVAHEDDYLRAIRATLELHARLDELCPPAGSAGGPVRLQSGVHTGLLVVRRLREGPRRYDITGAAAQVAARLAALASRDEVLVSPETQRLVAPFVQTEPLAETIVQAGRPPITPHRVVGESGLQTRLEAAGRAGLTPFVGRNSELTALTQHLDRARQGEGSVVVVAGEAGAGKSRLLHEFHERVDERAVRVLQGRCRSYGGSAPYLPFVEALQGALRAGGDPREPDAREIAARILAVDSSLEPYVPLLLRLLGMHHDAFPVPHHLQAEHLQVAMREALAAFFSMFARRRTSLVLLEDWHWSDESSREALRRLQDIVPAHALLIVLTSRPEAGALRDLLETGTLIQLGPLDHAGSVAIMRSVLQLEQVPAGLAARLHERTGGNPFFLEEVCQALLEEGAAGVRDGTAAGAEAIERLALPDTVQAVIRVRLDRLDPEAREVLRVASVIGREFERALLVEALGAGSDPSSELERLRLAGLIQQTAVVPEPAYRFKHVLTHEVTYESLLEHQCRTLHGVVGRALEQRHAGQSDQPFELLAHHFSRAESWAQAVEYGSRAATHAGAVLEYAGALDMLDRVHEWLLRLPDDAGRRLRLAGVMFEQERLCDSLGLRDRQQQIVGDLIALLAPHGASDELVQAYVRDGDLATVLKRFDAADRALATALRMSRERGGRALERAALRSVSLVRCHQGRWAEALAVAEGALAISREERNDVAVAGELASIGNILKNLGEHDRALASLEEAAAIPVLAEDPLRLSYVLHNMANVHRARGDLDRALELLRQAYEAATRTPLLPRQGSWALTAIAHVHLQQGRIDESLHTYGEAIAVCRRLRYTTGLVQALRALGEVEFGLGRDAEALPHLREAADLFARLGDRESEAQMGARVATILERTGAMPQAAGAWGQTLALRREMGDRHGELEALEGLARTTRRLAASSQEAAPRFEEALALASALGERRRQISLRNTLGILEWTRGRFADALGHYEAALSGCRELGDRHHEGLILNSLGVTLSRMQRYEEARTALEEALAVNRATGERLLEAHSLSALGDVYLSMTRPETAAEVFEESLAIRRAIGDQVGEGWMLQRLSLARAARGGDSGARAAAAAAARIAAECGNAALADACGLLPGESVGQPRED